MASSIASSMRAMFRLPSLVDLSIRKLAPNFGVASGSLLFFFARKIWANDNRTLVSLTSTLLLAMGFSIQVVEFVDGRCDRRARILEIHEDRLRFPIHDHVIQVLQRILAERPFRLRRTQQLAGICPVPKPKGQHVLRRLLVRPLPGSAAAQ